MLYAIPKWLLLHNPRIRFDADAGVVEIQTVRGNLQRFENVVDPSKGGVILTGEADDLFPELRSVIEEHLG